LRHSTVNIDKVQTLKSACSQKKKKKIVHCNSAASIHGVTPFMDSTEEEFERMYSGVFCGGGFSVVCGC
jgi:hypothetical protein